MDRRFDDQQNLFFPINAQKPVIDAIEQWNFLYSKVGLSVSLIGFETWDGVDMALIQLPDRFRPHETFLFGELHQQAYQKFIREEKVPNHSFQENTIL